MINRKIYNRLESLFGDRSRAILVTGARQIGKTYAIRKVAKEQFKQVIEINFLERPEAAELFDKAHSAKDILFRLTTITKRKIIPGKTLIFFDEVQACKEIVTAIKFLVEEGSCQYVLSGSLLGVELNDIRSVPVGYMTILDMYPVDLEEFALAIGISGEVLAHLRSCYEAEVPVDTFIHKRMIDLVTLYLMVGGMPAAVQCYLDSSNMQEVSKRQSDIIRLYKKDIAQYNKSQKLQLEEIFDLIPSELNAKNKRFILKEMNRKARYEKYAEGFLWLKDAGVALPTYNVEAPQVPLLLNKQHNLFKLFSNDVGLLACQYAGDIQVQLLKGLTAINYGAIFENLAAQELSAHGFAGDSRSLYYFNNKRQGELDFVIEHNGKAIPIEIKSGKEYQRHNALNGVMQNGEYAIDQAYVFCQGNIERKDKVLYLPIYMLMFLQKPEPAPLTYTLDLTGLK